MKKLLFCFVLFFSFHAYSIPEVYDTEIKQFIYNNLKNIEHKEKILNKMRLFSYYYGLKGNNYAVNKINLTIYYIEMFDIENLPQEQQKVILFFLKNA